MKIRQKKIQRGEKRMNEKNGTQSLRRGVVDEGDIFSFGNRSAGLEIIDPPNAGHNNAVCEAHHNF